MQITLSQLGNSILSAAEGLFVSMGMERQSPTFVNLSECVSIIIYCISFLLPAFFIFSNVSQRSDIKAFEKRLPKAFFPICIASLGCVAASGHLTAFIKHLLGYTGIGFYSYPITIPNDLPGMIIAFISWALVPAVVEELLFRKAVLGSLLPYGKTFALIVSSVAFSLMHCNPSQFLYTFAGGFLFGLTVIKYNSLLPSVCMHFINNALSLIYLLVDKYAGIKAYQITVFATESALMLFGLVFLIYLIKSSHFKTEEAAEQTGFSLYKGLLRVFAVGYVLYCIYISARWVYII